jgi:hypothetical protein
VRICAGGICRPAAAAIKSRPRAPELWSVQKVHQLLLAPQQGGCQGGALGGVLERIWQLARAARQSPALVSAPGLVPLVEELLAAVLRPIDHLFTSEDGAEGAGSSPEESAR